jgi:predicted DsbA family dithiol-disulfide isomerase
LDHEIVVVHAYYYTDPACPWSWALEPTLRKLAVEWRVRAERVGRGELWSVA